MKNWWKKYQLVVIAFFVTMTLGISCVIAYIVWNPSRIQTRVYENDYYTFHYDTTWKVQEEQEYQTVLSHDESSVSLQYLPLEETDYTT